MGMSKAKKPVTGAQDKDVVKGIEDIKKVSWQQQAMDDNSKRWWDWSNGNGPFAGKPKNVLDAPGMSDQMDIYGSAESLAQQDRFGDPTTAFASSSGRGANPFSAALAQTKEQNAMKRYDMRARGISDALQGARAEAMGMTQQGAQADQSRRENYAQGISKFNDGFYHRPQRQSPWMQALGMVVGGASSLGGGYLAGRK